MKKIGIMLTIVGVVCILGGIYGFILVGGTGLGGSTFDAAMRMISGSGAPSYSSLPALIARNRMFLLIGGVIVAIAGWMMVHRSRQPY